MRAGPHHPHAARWRGPPTQRHPGTDPWSGKPFIWHMFHARPGGGASPAGDGWPTAGEVQAAGGTKFGSVEVTEVRFPLFFKTHEFRPDSAGDGRHLVGLAGPQYFASWRPEKPTGTGPLPGLWAPWSGRTDSRTARLVEGAARPL